MGQATYMLYVTTVEISLEIKAVTLVIGSENGTDLIREDDQQEQDRKETF